MPPKNIGKNGKQLICQSHLQTDYHWVINELRHWIFGSIALLTRYLDLYDHFWSFVNLKKYSYCWWKMANSNFGTSSYQAGREGDFSKLSQQIGTNIQKISQNGKKMDRFGMLSNWERLWCIFCFSFLTLIASSMQRIVVQLGTPADNQQLRNQLWVMKLFHWKFPINQMLTL